MCSFISKFIVPVTTATKINLFTVHSWPKPGLKPSYSISKELILFLVLKNGTESVKESTVPPILVITHKNAL